jgi:phage tail sheath protein FI
MPITPTYPGVYVQEIPSGVHTIVGVATSITAFLGQAQRGPINKAVHILSLKDYERSFGGLSADSDMSYAVSQFFLNGGSDAYIVRLARNDHAASAILLDAGGTEVLTIIALDQGAAGNNIQFQLSANAINPGNFDLTINYVSATNQADNRTEVFQNLSMDPASPRFIEDIINGASQLVTVTVNRSAPPNIPNKLAPPSGGITSDAFAESELGTASAPGPLRPLPDATHNSFKIGFNGHDATDVVTIDSSKPGDSSSLAAYLTDIAARIQTAVRLMKPTIPAWSKFTCTSDGTHLILSSGTPGLAGSVKVANADNNSIFAQLHLDHTTVNQATPLTSASGGITSGAFADNEVGTSGPLHNLPDATHNSFKIGFDGRDAADVVTIDSSKPGDTSSLAAYLIDIAARIQKAVRSMKPGLASWRDFTCTSDSTHLILSSGTPGQRGSVKVADTDKNSIFSQLHLNQATVNKPNVPSLSLGSGDPFELDDPDALSIYTGDAVQRTGIQALEGVDLFNLLCLPGVTQAGIQTMAIQYCKTRRAVCIVDPPPDLKPADMVARITGPLLPKGDLGTYAAIYYPWVKAPDPLKGKLRSFPPSGMIAGLYARTDAARGVWKAPAGTDATLVGVQGLDYVLTDPENGTLNPHGVNCLRIFPVFGAVSWGARTVSGDDQIGSEYKYVPIRRTALFIEESLYRGLKWAVFEPNDEPLWAQIRLNVGAFMQNLFRLGAFQGQSPRDAYFVKCDKETTTQNDINLGIVNILVGFAPLKPAEFVIISLQQIAGQIQV